MENQRNIHLSMPNGGQDGVIFARFSGESSRVEFRGLPYTEWSEEEPEPNNWFRRIHDALEGWHSTVLHQDEELTVLPWHPDYEAVFQLMIEAETFKD
jgi:hypothetical protein